MNTDYQLPARFYGVDEGFNVARDKIPARIFLDEARRAMKPGGQSQQIHCDLSATMGGASPATSPLMLASYLKLVRDQPLLVTHHASTEIYYVIDGHGATTWEGGSISWAAGDVFRLPGGVLETHVCGDAEQAALWVCTDQPLLKLAGGAPLPVPVSSCQPVHFTKQAMFDALAQALTQTRKNGDQARSIMFGDSDGPGKTISPALTLALNSIAPNDFQKPHRHNSAAISLVLAGENCYSIVGDMKVDWIVNTTFLTPAADLHSHHNPTDKDAMLLIVQDGAFYYHCRTMGYGAN